LVLDAFNAGKRINYDAVAAQVAAMSAGDAAALRAALQRGLPMTLPLPPGARTAANLQALAALQVKARVVTPATVPVLLDGELRRRLATTHQLVVRDVTVGQARLCHCRRCGYAWKTVKAPGEPVPLRCPSCRSPEWGRWRIFKCAWCGHEFDTADVHTRRAALCTLVSGYAFHTTAANADRIAAQIVSGIGFIGGGTILKERGSIKGLTTAAGLWAAAALGMAAGAGLYFMGIATAVIILLT